MEGRRLRIALVALGYLPIPPCGYGGIESIIWQYAQRLRAKGHEVDIVNANKHRLFFDLVRRGRYDLVHVHHERGLSRAMLASLPWGSRIACTTHRGYFLDRLDRDAEKCLRMTARARRILVMRDDVAAELRRRNPKADVAVLPNGVEAKDFRVALAGNGRAICLGVIEPRKRQDFVARELAAAGLPCDFAGPVKKAILPAGASYLGEWTRDTIRDRLTEYSALILVSDREGGGPPLAVAEALAAGLSVVVSPMAYGGLDLRSRFVHQVHTDDELVPAVRSALAASDSQRQAARRFALEVLDWDVLADRYEQLLLRWTAG
jgi:glycosyltransferase involved in cell wall biosynthesis